MTNKASTSFVLKVQTDEGQILEVENDVVAESTLLRDYMQQLSQQDSHEVIIPLPNIGGATLMKIISYCKHEADRKKTLSPSPSPRDIKLGGHENLFELDNKTFNDIVMAAAYLGVESLLELTCNHAVEHKPWGREAVRTVPLEDLMYWEVVWTYFREKREAREATERELLQAKEARESEAKQTQDIQKESKDVQASPPDQRS